MQWWFWKTAVSEEKRTAVSAEKKFLFWLHIWRPFFKHELPMTNIAFPQSSGREVTAYGRLCIVYEEKPRALYEIHQFWQMIQNKGLIENDTHNVLVAWELTLFGQLALRRHYGSALKALLYVIGRTIRHPRAIASWSEFIKTAIRYFS